MREPFRQSFHKDKIVAEYCLPYSKK